ncbi:MAG: glycosyltransferase family 4 protein [Candidatus Dormibacteria bacterium]
MAPSLRFVLPRYGSTILGGAETLVRNLAVELATRDWNIQIWTTPAEDESTWSGSNSEGSNIPNLTITRFPVEQFRHPQRFAMESRLFFRLPRALRWESLWFCHEGPYTPRLVEALRTAEPLPTVFVPYLFWTTVAGFAAYPGPRLLLPCAHDELPFHLKKTAILFENADGLLFNTDEERAVVHATYPLTAYTPSLTGTTGVDTTRCPNPDRFRARHHIDGQYLLYGGRTTPGKGIGLMMDGMEKLRSQHVDVSLVLIGDSSHVPISLGITPLGYLPEEERIDALAGATAVIIPGAHESLSLMALDAWSLGRPILANSTSTVLSGHIERSHGGIRFSTPEEFANGARHLLNDPAGATQLGLSGKQYVASQYAWDSVVANLTTLLTEVDHAANRP